MYSSSRQWLGTLLTLNETLAHGVKVLCRLSHSSKQNPRQLNASYLLQTIIAFRRRHSIHKKIIHYEQCSKYDYDWHLLHSKKKKQIAKSMRQRTKRKRMRNYSHFIICNIMEERILIMLEVRPDARPHAEIHRAATNRTSYIDLYSILFVNCGMYERQIKYEKIYTNK